MATFSAEMMTFKNARPGVAHYQVNQIIPVGEYTHETVFVNDDGTWRHTEENFLYTSKQAAYRAIRQREQLLIVNGAIKMALAEMEEMGEPLTLDCLYSRAQHIATRKQCAEYIISQM